MDCIEAAFDEVGIVATSDQMKHVASSVEMGYEMYGQAHGYDCIPNPVLLENEKLKEELDTERRKIVCVECKGKGRIYSQGPYHGSDSQCHICHGEGYRLP
jgi:hypothetical protein